MSDYWKLQRVSALNAELEVLKAEVEGMKAENEIRQIQGLSPAYGESDFGKIACSMRSLANQIIQL